MGCCGPEESDFAAEESYGEGDPDAEEGYEEYEEDDPDAEEGYEEVWDEVQEALSAMEHEDDDDPFIVLTETKFSFRCIPVWIGTLLTGLGSKKKHM